MVSSPVFFLDVDMEVVAAFSVLLCTECESECCDCLFCFSSTSLGNLDTLPPVAIFCTHSAILFLFACKYNSLCSSDSLGNCLFRFFFSSGNLTFCSEAFFEVGSEFPGSPFRFFFSWVLLCFYLMFSSLRMDLDLVIVSSDIYSLPVVISVV